MRAGWTPIAHTGEQRQERSLVYDIARFIGSPFSYDLLGFENVQTSGPAIYTANHLGPLGPIEVLISVPMRFYIWAIAEMTDYDRAPEYLFHDFVQPVLHLGGSLGMLFSTGLTKVAVRFLRELGVISIDRFGGSSIDGFRQSLNLLMEGKNLLIFPEDPARGRDLESQMTPFKKGFARLGEQYYARTRRPLRFCPLAVHADSYRVQVGASVAYNWMGDPRHERLRLKSVLEANIRKMVLEMAMDHYIGIPLHH